MFFDVVLVIHTFEVNKSSDMTRGFVNPLQTEQRMCTSSYAVLIHCDFQLIIHNISRDST